MQLLVRHDFLKGAHQEIIWMSFNGEFYASWVNEEQPEETNEPVRFGFQ